MATKSIRLSDGTDTLLPEAGAYGSNSSGQYLKLADGTLFQWGISGQYASGNTANVAITMPLAFVNSWYTVISNGEVGDDPTNYEVLIVIQRNSSQQFTAHIRNATGNYTRQFGWLAIGRWK